MERSATSMGGTAVYRAGTLVVARGSCRIRRAAFDEVRVFDTRSLARGLIYAAILNTS